MTKDGSQTTLSGAMPLQAADSQAAMHDSFWLGVWPGIDDARMDYMVETLSDVTKEALR